MAQGVNIPERRVSQSRMATTLQKRGPSYLAVFFILSLLVPMIFRIGPILLMPHRIVLLLVFIPLLAGLLSGKAGRVLLIDWLMLFSALWAALALAVNHGLGASIEAMGIHILEFFGAYLLGRVAIRSAGDFRLFVLVFFCVVLFLLPFAALESITRKPILLDLIPNSLRPVTLGVRMGMRRAQTIFAHPILYGAFVSAGCGLFWYSLKPSMRSLSFFVVALSTIFSLSAGALIAFFFQSGLIAWDWAARSIRHRWRIFGLGGVAAYIVIDLISNRSPFHVITSYASFSPDSAYNRILIWEFGTQNVMANPIFGLGLNDWERPSWMGGSIDNFWLLVAMQFGLPAIGSFVIALVIIVWRLSRATLKNPFDQACRAGYLVTLGGIVIAGGTVHYWHAIMAFVLFFFGSGVWMISGGASEDVSGQPVPGHPGETPAPPSPKSRYSRFAATKKR